MKVLLTGATGFIGSHLARLLLRDGCEVYALLRPESDLWRIRDLSDQLHLLTGDLLSQEQVTGCLERCRPELCFHLAWYAEPGKYLSSPLNVAYLNASLHLASCLAETGCRRLVVAGSVAEYDTERGYLSETSPTRPRTLYAASKLALYTVLAQLAPQLGLELAWARIFYVYGSYEDERRFIPAVISSLLRGEATKLTPGEQVRDYLHVEDVAGALWAVAQSGLSGVVNIGSGLPVTNKEIALRIGAILGRSELVKFGDLPYRSGDPMFVCADNRRFLKHTDWQPRHGIEEGLKQTTNWWKKRFSSKRYKPNRSI